MAVAGGQGFGFCILIESKAMTLSWTPVGGADSVHRRVGGADREVLQRLQPARQRAVSFLPKRQLHPVSRNREIF